MKKVLLAVAAMALMAVPAMAAVPGQTPSGTNTNQYHSYDGLICTDCHTLHGSEDGAAVAKAGETRWTGFDDLTQGGGYRELLKKGDWTDMCLSCHKQGFNTAETADLPGVESVKYGNWTAPIVMTLDGVDPANKSLPGGDFYYSNLDPKKGHNPAYTAGTTDFTTTATATSKLMTVDSTLKGVPPGGSGGITDGEWSCHSCHGMHARFSGSYTAYRQLKRKVNGIMITGRTNTNTLGVETYSGAAENTAAGYEPILSNSRGDLQAGTLNATNLTKWVAARKDGNPLEAADLFADESETNKNVYRGGFSSFCSACHGNFHGGAGELVNNGEDANGVTNVGGTWVKHPTNIKMGQLVSSRKYGKNTYKKAVTNSQNTSPNPSGYDWKYPIVQPDANFDVKSTVTGGTLHDDDRVMCLTCHKAHATQYENMVRWDANAHSFIANGETDMTGEASNGDNIAYGCGKCHQKGGADAFVKSF